MCHFIIIRLLPLNESALAQRSFNGGERRARPICLEMSGRGVGTACFVGAGGCEEPPWSQQLAASRAPLWERGWHRAHPSVHPISLLEPCTPQKTHPKPIPPPPKRGTQSRRHQPEMTFLYFRMERKWGRKGCTAVVQNNRWGWGAIGEATAHGGPRPHVPFAAVGRLAPRPGQRRLWLN